MARCCGQSGCACMIQAGNHITISGVGSSQDPFVVAADVDFEVVDNSVFNLSLGGAGTVASPWTLGVGFASTAKLDDIPDVVITSPTNTQVIAYDSATGKWTNQAKTTAASGSVAHDTSMSGDGSGGTPLVINEDPAGYLTTGAAGLGLSLTGRLSLVRRFGTAAARTASTDTPALNAITMLDTAPGQMDYWNGAAWTPVTNGLERDFGGEMLALSGSYVTGLPITIYTRTISFTTAADGSFDVIPTTDLTTAAGVLTCHFQETGSIPFKAMVYPSIDHVSGTAYRLDDGTAYASQVLTGVVTAYIY